MFQKSSYSSSYGILPARDLQSSVQGPVYRNFQGHAARMEGKGSLFQQITLKLVCPLSFQHVFIYPYQVAETAVRLHLRHVSPFR